MSSKRVAVDYGDRKIDIEVPESAFIAEYHEGTLIENPREAVLNALSNPLGMPPLTSLAKPGMKVAIGFDDITRPNLPARTILPILVEELNRAGIQDRDILFICASSNHRKPTRTELANHLGPALFNRFWRLNAIVNHDCTNQEELTYLGITESGRYVEHNNRFLDADLMIYQGNVSSAQGPSYTGTGVCIGLASTKSIASHHSINAIPDPEAKKMQSGEKKKAVNVKDEMSAFMEQATGKQVFYINSINGIGGKMIGVHAGHASSIKAPAWELANSRFVYDTPQADVLIVGLSASFSYGNANNTLIAGAGTFTLPRYNAEGPVLREGGVVIAVSPTTGFIDPQLYPSYQKVIDVYGSLHSPRGLIDYEDEFNNNLEYTHKYTYEHGYPPLHPFWLLYENEYSLNRAGAVIMAGTSNPGAFRAIGMSTAPNFDAAWKMAKKIVGESPRTVVAPSFWSKPRIKFRVDA
jgi:nickel-dependent lactate racemase